MREAENIARALVEHIALQALRPKQRNPPLGRHALLLKPMQIPCPRIQFTLKRVPRLDPERPMPSVPREIAGKAQRNERNNEWTNIRFLTLSG